MGMTARNTEKDNVQGQIGSGRHKTRNVFRNQHVKDPYEHGKTSTNVVVVRPPRQRPKQIQAYLNPVLECVLNMNTQIGAPLSNQLKILLLPKATTRRGRGERGRRGRGRRSCEKRPKV